MTINESIEKVSNKLILLKNSNNILKKTFDKLKDLKEKVGGDSKLSEQSIRLIKKLLEDQFFGYTNKRKSNLKGLLFFVSINSIDLTL